jgi:hypothetical protein
VDGSAGVTARRGPDHVASSHSELRIAWNARVGRPKKGTRLPVNAGSTTRGSPAAGAAPSYEATTEKARTTMRCTENRRRPSGYQSDFEEHHQSSHSPRLINSVERPNIPHECSRSGGRVCVAARATGSEDRDYRTRRRSRATRMCSAKRSQQRVLNAAGQRTRAAILESAERVLVDHGHRGLTGDHRV